MSGFDNKGKQIPSKQQLFGNKQPIPPFISGSFIRPSNQVLDEKSQFLAAQGSQGG